MEAKKQAFAPMKKGTIRVIIKNEQGEQFVFEQDFETAKITAHREHNIPLVMMLSGF